VSAQNWKWFGHAAHLCVGHDCRFHLATLVGDYLVSTVGEYWPSRAVREITAKHKDAAWYAENGHLKGDYFDAAYQDRFGFDTVGLNRTYETMVFKAGAPCRAEGCGCGLPEIDGSEQDFHGYNDAASATAGHMELCEKWAAKQFAPQSGNVVEVGVTSGGPGGATVE